MQLFVVTATVFLAFAAVGEAFISSSSISTASAFRTTNTAQHAKYNSMDEVLALFPEDKPILINFYDAKTEEDIKKDIMTAKQLLADRATLVSMKQQDYPELAKLWDADDKSPSMILFKDGQPVTRIYEETNFLEIAATVGRFCDE